MGEERISSLEAIVGGDCGLLGPLSLGQPFTLRSMAQHSRLENLRLRSGSWDVPATVKVEEVSVDGFCKPPLDLACLPLLASATAVLWEPLELRARVAIGGGVGATLCALFLRLLLLGVPEKS